MRSGRQMTRIFTAGVVFMSFENLLQLCQRHDVRDRAAMWTAGSEVGMIHMRQQFLDLSVIKRMSATDYRVAGNTGKQTFHGIIEGPRSYRTAPDQPECRGSEPSDLY